MKRRKFIKNSLVATGMATVSGVGSGYNVLGSSENTLENNTLGRTGEKVSKLAFGCAPLGWDHLTKDDVAAIVEKAVDLGINYFDTAPNYRNSEERLGGIVPSVRDKIFLVSKTEEPDYDGTWRLLEQSLKRMNTDYIDLIHIHNLGRQDRFEDIDFTFSDKGSLGALRKAKEQGVIRFIGASGHVYPTRFHKAIDNGEIDVFMNAVNFIIQHTYNFEDKIWLRAKEKNIGLVAMKVFGGAIGRQNSRILPEDREMALRYAYSLPGLSTAVIGMKNVEELVENVEAVKNVQALTEEEMYVLSQRGLKLAQSEEWKTVHGTPVI